MMELNEIFNIYKEYKELIGFKGKTVSLIPVCESYITLSGFKYPLDDVVNFGTTLTMSNIVVEDIAEICVDIVLGKNTSKPPSLVCLPVTYAYGGTTKNNEGEN